ncbi:MAG: hypothetical protein KA436_10010 [Oligoflexales bacterium]|nr:hypothetical protein [Oligoflexales bacterium]
MPSLVEIIDVNGDCRLRMGSTRVDYLDIQMESTNSSVKSTVYMYKDIPLLGDFFEDLAQNWKGWEGKRIFRSVESDFRIEAVHDHRSRVDFCIFLEGSMGSASAWSHSEHIQVECGTLSNLSKDVQDHLLRD